MTHYVHYVNGGERRWNEHGRELNALRHELRAILVMLECRTRWQVLIVPSALLAHAGRLVHAFEGYVDCPSHDSPGAAEAAEFRKRLLGLRKSVPTLDRTHSSHPW